MPDPTRPTPGRRLNQGALVVILTALMLVNLATVGLLVLGGAFAGEKDTADQAPAASPALAQNQSTQASDTHPPETAHGRPIRNDQPATPAGQVPAEVPPAASIDAQSSWTPGDGSADPALTEPRDLPRVAERTPTPAVEPAPEPALPPVEFFGIPVFE